MIRTTQKKINEIQLYADLNDQTCGAKVVFSGIVRNHHEGRGVEKLIYELHEPMVLKVLETIQTEAINQFNVKDIWIIHRYGELNIQDTAIWIGAQSHHRKESFLACEYAINAVKKRAPIWKKEFYTDQTSSWVQCHCIEDHHHDSEKH